jgi:hypothetical protein
VDYRYEAEVRVDGTVGDVERQAFFDAVGQAGCDEGSMRHPSGGVVCFRIRVPADDEHAALEVGERIVDAVFGRASIIGQGVSGRWRESDNSADDDALGSPT